MNKYKAKHLLFSPLDWGMGHTTRCIPLIRHLLACGNTVTVACNAVQRNILSGYFPHIDYQFMEGYNIAYSGIDYFNKVKIGGQLLGLQRLIKRENTQINAIINQCKPDGIISDNRYGIYSPRISSVMLTHQLRLHSGWGRAVDDALEQYHYRLLSKFAEIWIPDVPDNTALAGTLSHPATLPRQAQYIGLLSQFSCLDAPPRHLDKPYTLLLLSGVEQQRAKLEQLLVKHLAKENIVLIKGKEGYQGGSSSVQTIPFASHAALYALIAGAQKVVCRSGYSSVMDLIYTQKPALLIPTPGQPEQEYLAHYWQQRGYFNSIPQSMLNSNTLNHVLPIANIPFTRHHFELHKPIIENWVANL
ncbi:MAG: glycosyl transferase family 28 [Chitinophagia bacterium]|nr:glycosyl transferase family 28 [Chitinophagia bacterium]